MCIQMWMYVCIWMKGYVQNGSAEVYVHVDAEVCVNEHVKVHVYVCGAHVLVCLPLPRVTHTPMHIYACIYMYIYICLHIYIYICIYMYID